MNIINVDNIQVSVRGHESGPVKVQKASKCNSVCYAAQPIIQNGDYSQWHLKGQILLTADAQELAEVQWLAEQGLAIAQNNLGCFYEKGIGVTQDDRIAVHWYTKAAEQDLPVAQYNLGRMFEKGLGIEQDVEQAEELYKLAEAQGYQPATEVLETYKAADALLKLRTNIVS